MKVKLSYKYKQTEVGVIPEEWEVFSLSELTEPHRPISYGIVQTGPNVPNGVRCIRVLDIHQGRINKAELITTSNQISDSYRRTVLKVGDLVMPLRGKVGDVGLVDEELAGANLTRGVALIAIRTGWSPVFCQQVISSASTRRRLEQAMNGSALQEIPIASLRSFKIATPKTLSEQLSIAAALSDVDELLSGLDRLIAKKRDLKQAAMQQLLTGQTRLPGFSGAWEVKRLGGLIDEIADGGTPATSNPRNFGGSVCWVVIDDIKDDITATATTLTELGLKSCAARIWEPGTLILSTGATIGEVGIARIPVATKQGICGIVVNPAQANANFLKYWFIKSKPLLLSKAQGSTIKEVRAPTLVQFEISIPKLPEQTAIASVLSDMDAELAALEARRDKTRDLKQAMMQDLLTGKSRLVPEGAAHA